MRKDLQLLLRAIEPQVIGMLIANDYITSASTKYSDMKLTAKGKSATGMDDPLITEEWLKGWRSKWPVESRASMKIIREKINRFLLENDVEIREIEKATDRWLEMHNYPYCGYARHFFYKQERGEEFSRCMELIEILRDEGEEEDIFDKHMKVL